MKVFSLIVIILLMIPAVIWAAVAIETGQPESLWGALALFGLGMIQKHAIKKLPNRAIPWINLALGTAVGYATTGTVETAIQFGAASATMATGGHQLLKTALDRTPVRRL